MGLIISQGRLFDPRQKLDLVGDLFIEDGKIVGINQMPAQFQAEQTLLARNHLVCPGLIDFCARLGEPGHEQKGTIFSETKAALAGGVTTLLCPPDTDPIIDEAATVELIRRRACDAGFAKVLPLGALTVALQGEQLGEMATLKKAGCIGMTNAGYAIKDSNVLRRAFEYAATHDITVFLQANDPWLTGAGCAHEGQVATRLGLRGIPEAAETVALARLIELVAITGVRAHFCRLTSQRGVQMIATAKDQGLPITADVSIHHLLLSEHDLADYNAMCHVQPPFRNERDCGALIQALNDGVLDVVCSDHQPHEVDAKLAPFAKTEAGVSAVEFLLPLLLKLVDDKHLSLATAIACASQTPAEILGLQCGTLSLDAPADICIVDTECNWEIRSEKMYSAGKNTPLENWQLNARVKQTLCDGRVFDF